MKFEQNNKALISFLDKNMESCGYSTNVSAQDASIYEVYRDGRFIGTYDADGDLDLMERSAGEREKLQNVMDFTCAFATCPPAFMGQVLLSEYQDTNFTAAINPDTGKPVYHVFHVDADIITPEDLKEYAHHNLQAAKVAFAEAAGLSSGEVYAKRYEDKVSAKHLEYLQGHGYKLTPAAHGEDDKRLMIRKDNRPVGFIDNDYHVHITTNDDLIAKHMKSLAHRARWEVQQDDSNGESVFTKRLADALVRMGYRIRHVWQEFQMMTGVFRDGSEIARISGSTKVSYSPAARNEDVKNIEAAKERTAADLEKEYRRYHKAMQSVEQEMAADAAAPGREKAEAQTGLTDSQVLFLKALLSSEHGKALAAKVDMPDMVSSIHEKLSVQYPHLPDHSRNEEAPEQLASQNAEPDDGLEP